MFASIGVSAGLGALPLFPQAMRELRNVSQTDTLARRRRRASDSDAHVERVQVLLACTAGPQCAKTKDSVADIADTAQIHASKFLRRRSQPGIPGGKGLPAYISVGKRVALSYVELAL